MKKILSLSCAFLLVATSVFAYFGSARFGDGAFGTTAFSIGAFGEGVDPFAGLGLTFLKQYDINQASLDADRSVGSKTATFTASRGATTPATTIETQDGNALLFSGVDNGTDEDVTIPADESIQIFGSTAYSLHATINAQSLGVGTPPILDTTGGQAVRFRLINVSDNTSEVTLKVDFGAGTDAVATTTGNVIKFGTKHNIAAVFNEDSDNKIKIYVDGVLASLSTDTAGIGTIDDDSSDVKLIGNVTNGSGTFDGQIFDLKIFRNKALSSAEVSTLNNGGTVTGATAHWDMNEGTGTTITDIVNSNIGTLEGSPLPKWLTDGSTYVTKVTADDTARFTTGTYTQNGTFTSRPGLIVERASTNLLIHGIFDADTAGLATGWTVSDDVTNSPTTTIVEETVTNISNSHAQRWQHTFGDGTFSFFLGTNTAVGSVVQNELVTFSVWLKGTVTGINTFSMRIREKDSSGIDGSEGVSTDIKASISSTDWKRFEFTYTAVDADASLVNVRFLASHSGSGSIDMNIMGAQVQQKAYADSLIPTTSAALTRNTEVLKYKISGNMTAAIQTIVVKVTPNHSSATAGERNNNIIDTDTKRRFLARESGQAQFRMFPNTTDSSTSLVQDVVSSWSAYDSLVLGYSMQSGTSPYISGYLSGVAAGTDETTDDFTANAWGTDFLVGDDTNGNNNFDGIIEAVAFFDKFLTAAEHLRVKNILNP